MIDASLRALVLGSLRALNMELAIPIIYITHDLTTAYHIADTIIVLYRGAVVEAGDAATVIRAPLHPYTQLLIDSIPWPDLETSWGAIPEVPVEQRAEQRAAPTAGCAFAPRCPHVMPRCRVAVPRLFAAGPDQIVRCLLHELAPACDPAQLGERLQTVSTDKYEVPS
jgi:peptide/nickel transport system ATP-binding protein